jgi:hypothetical protein
VTPRGAGDAFSAAAIDGGATVDTGATGGEGDGAGVGARFSRGTGGRGIGAGDGQIQSAANGTTSMSPTAAAAITASITSLRFNRLRGGGGVTRGGGGATGSMRIGGAGTAACVFGTVTTVACPIGALARTSVRRVCRVGGAVTSSSASIPIAHELGDRLRPVSGQQRESRVDAAQEREVEVRRRIVRELDDRVLDGAADRRRAAACR